MDRQTAFLLALGLLILAAAIVSVTGWILFVRDRRAGRPERRETEMATPLIRAPPTREVPSGIARAVVPVAHLPDV